MPWYVQRKLCGFFAECTITVGIYGQTLLFGTGTTVSVLPCEYSSVGRGIKSALSMGMSWVGSGKDGGSQTLRIPCDLRNGDDEGR